ncbi:PREDICTED: LOC109946780, partial [Prunus dulcis]
ESYPPPLTRSKRLRKRTVVENVATESAAAPTTTSGTAEELREAFEVVEQEKEAVEEAQEKTKEVEED